MKRIPVLATLVVAAAVVTMVALGFWQLDRMHWKNALLERYAVAAKQDGQVPFPHDAATGPAALYRRSALQCAKVLDSAAISGRNAKGEAGWSITARCALAQGGEATVVLGWARRAVEPVWNGGNVTGVIGPAAHGDVRLVAQPAQAGLDANALPDPREVPNNHFSYAMQWFFFAAAAAIIYAIAVGKRLAAGRAGG